MKPHRSSVADSYVASVPYFRRTSFEPSIPDFLSKRYDGSQSCTPQNRTSPSPTPIAAALSPMRFQAVRISCIKRGLGSRLTGAACSSGYWMTGAISGGVIDHTFVGTRFSSLRVPASGFYHYQRMSNKRPPNRLNNDVVCRPGIPLSRPRFAS